MATAVYGTDLTSIDTAEALGNYTALGGGASGLSDETDYYIQGTQCVSKAGFTAVTKGMILNTGTRTVASGDAVFIWLKQNNRNLMDTVANGGTQVLIGDSTTAYDHFYVDGNDSQGSALAGWRTYAVDPTATPSTTTGSPTTTNRVGALWKILGSGSLKGNPNGIDASWHGRELQVTEGFTVAEGTFAGAGAADATTRWGILTPVAGGYQFHGAFVMGTTSTACSFTDANVNIIVLEDEFVLSGFNEFEMRNASTVVNWDNISIQHLGTTSPSLLTFNVGTFTGDSNKFTGCGATTFNSAASCTNSTWTSSDEVTANGADLSGSQFLTSTAAADGACVIWDEALAAPKSITELTGCTFSKGTNAHHAIEFGTGIDEDITLTDCNFNGFSSTDDVNGSTFAFLGSTNLTLNLVGCTVDGADASSSNIGIDSTATITINIDPVTVLVNVKNEAGSNIQNARVFVETAGAGGEAFEQSITSITQTAGTATVTCGSAHNLLTNDKMVIRGAQPDTYNKVAVATVTGANTFTYPVDSGSTSPATGTPVLSYVAIEGLTDASGNRSVSRTFTSQDYKGWARLKNTSAPFYKDANFAFAVNTTAGNTLNLTLSND